MAKDTLKLRKNAEVPFFVKTNDVQVQVVGTVFNVRAYDDDNYVMVSLLEGRDEFISVC